MNHTANERRNFLTGKSLRETGGDQTAPTHAESSGCGLDDQTYLLDITRTAMACQFQILLNAGEHHSAAETAVEALDLVEKLEQQLSVFQDHSQITQLNLQAAEQPQRVPAELFKLLQLAKQIWRDTDGAFDITATPLSKTWGFFRRQSALPAEQDIAISKNKVGCQFLTLSDGMVSFDNPELELNLGGIGKGHALDCCHLHFVDKQIENYLMHGGQSSILARGNRKNSLAQGRGWQIALRHPLIPDLKIANLWIRDLAVGTSGDANQFFYHQGKRYGHVMDPRTGWPVQNTLSATVLAPCAAAADALATAFFVLGPAQSAQYCRQHPDTAFIITQPGKHHRTPVMHLYGIDRTNLEMISPNVELVTH